MNAILSQIVFQVRRVDEQLIKYGFIVFMLVIAILQGAPIDGPGGVR